MSFLWIVYDKIRLVFKLYYPLIRPPPPAPKTVFEIAIRSLTIVWKCLFNSLPKDKMLDWSKLKALAHDKVSVVENLEFVFEGVENIVGKGEISGYQHFLFFPHFFSNGFFLRVVKGRDCVVKS